MSEPVAFAPRKPFLSLILLREGALTHAQLEPAIAEWNRRREAHEPAPFGQIILALGLLDDQALAPYLSLQRKLAAIPGEGKPLGHLLIENALLKPSQVSAALQLQRRTGQRLGELLLSEHILREPQLEVLLRFQARDRVAS